MIIGFLQPRGELLDDPHGDLPVGPDHALEGFPVDDENLAVFNDRGRCRTGTAVQNGHLPEEFPLTQDHQRLFDMAHPLADAHLPGENNVHLLTRVSLVEENGSRGNNFTVLVKQMADAKGLPGKIN